MTSQEQELFDKLVVMTPEQYDRWMGTTRPFDPNVNVGLVMVAREKAILQRVRENSK